MLDMLGEDARSAVGKVKQLQSQGMTPDQIDAQMMEAARNGLLPISVAFAAQKALQRKNPPAPPPQGTVVGDMLGQLQGIAALPAPTMDNAQFAGGGIVAFADGGTARTATAADLGIRGNRPAMPGDFGTPEELADLEDKVRKGTATPDERTKWQRFKSAFGKKPAEGIKDLMRLGRESSAARGVLGRVAGYAAPVLSGAAVYSQMDEVPDEYLQAFYSGKGDTSAYWDWLERSKRGENVPNPFAAEDTVSGAAGAVGRRLHSVLGKTLDTVNFFDVAGDLDPNEKYYRELAERRAAAEKAANNAPPPPPPSAANLDFSSIAGAQQGGGGDPYAGLSVPSQAGGIRAAYEAARRAVGSTDESKVGKLEDFIDEQRRIDEAYELDKPLKGQQAKIAERRAKLDEDYSKSMLTDLGLAFLTKGVMAAGEGKDTLSAMAFAIGEGAKTTKERRERIDQIREKLDDREATIESQLANMRQNQVTRGLERRKEELALVRDNKARLTTLGLEESKALLAESGRQQDAALRIAIARIQANEPDKVPALEQASRDYLNLMKAGKTKEAAFIRAQIVSLAELDPAYLATQARLEADAKKRQALGGGAGGTGEFTVLGSRPE